jgi:hypothetical protein
MQTRLTSISIPLSVFMSGLYGGIGFFSVIGHNPAMRRLDNAAFAEYWQSIDHYMGARMPVFGPLLILTLLFGTITLIPKWRTPSFWLLFIAFLLLITDMVFAFSVNVPLNQQIQSWDVQQLPANVGEIKAKVVQAFSWRSFFMLASFACVVLAAFSRRPRW